MKCLNLHFKKKKSEERSREKWSKNTNVRADLCWCVIYLLVASVLTKRGGLKCKFIKHAYKKYQLVVRIWAWGYYLILWRDNTNEAELRTPFQTDFNVKFQRRSIKAALVNIIIVPLLLQFFCSISKAKLKIILVALLSLIIGLGWFDYSYSYLLTC